ncbi:MAG: VirB8/TrbF family protein [Gemmatimonadaceae bacterium]
MTTQPPPPTLPPAGFEYGEARRRYIEAFGSTQVMNTYLKLAVLGLTLVAVALVGLTIHTQRTYAHVKPLVIRIDDVGRATAVNYDHLTYTPQAPELRYFLTQFVVKHYSRMRATVKQEYGESLYFLDGRLADATMQASAKTGVIERFLTSGEEEVEVHVKNVTLEDLRQPPYRATVDFDEVHLAPATRAEIRRDTFLAHVVFVLRDSVDNARIPINPLGLTITYLREDQAFVTDQERQR